MRTFAHATLAAAVLLSAAVTPAQPVFISTGLPDGRLGTASNTAGGGQIERETADDFLLTHVSSLTSASFYGLLPRGLTPSDITALSVEIYGVFPVASNVGRTSGPPLFSTPLVPTRVNSPSDVDLVGRSIGSGLTFSATLLGPFNVANSVVNGINPTPGNLTGGEGPVSGDEVRIDVTFTDPFILQAGHYFIVPTVGLTNGTFLWLSAAKPIVGGTPFLPDLQTWIRNANLDPDWLRVGTDVIGAPSTGGPPPTFNAAFTLSGAAVPEPSTLALLAGGLTLVAGIGARRRRT
ncbi:PEP motif putative anchor domain protein [Gemmatirosa kalamazoonensis]|uniref:PEP motif putative anchor domain protein n=1 Tax=Gemmatirosa kalamazoonensis TaxID=861299 RepID=W0RLG0_9BACT|nr:PEP-CTERM sorting domain-containing protein [Gemmatirosa kalamazoonensis]AHG91919.1 PEP motif putative anchor domain protein [Gemmatirosa kalamazoonensis]